ncbi:MAG: hypothetical protein GDA40_07025 [Rhodobacteraceae bacterium]|nr:hypothetical protein [Paracoccaceae bacterium]
MRDRRTQCQLSNVIRFASKSTRIDTDHASVLARLDRIQRRLDLADAPAE